MLILIGEIRAGLFQVKLEVFWEELMRDSCKGINDEGVSQLKEDLKCLTGLKDLHLYFKK